MPATATLTTSSQQFSQIQTDSNIITSQTTHISAPQQQQQLGQVQQVVQVQQTPPQPQPVSTPSTTPLNPSQTNSKPNTPKQPTTPQPPSSQKTITPSPTPADSSSGPPPAKKAKSKSKANNKKKVTLDLEQLLKQSGIMDEDLQDDSFGFSFSSQDDSGTAQNGFDGDFLSLSEESPTKTNSVQDPVVQSSGMGVDCTCIFVKTQCLMNK